MPLNVGLNAVSLLSPLTGVGQYTLRLIAALQDEPDVSVSYFNGAAWSERRLQCDCAASDLNVSSPLLAPAGQRIFLHAKRAFKALVPKSYDLMRLCQQQTFKQGLKKAPIELYHEPNFIPFKFNGPTVITVHDLSVLALPETHAGAAVRAVGRRLPRAVERADAVIAVSHATREEIIKMLNVNPAKVFTIYNGVGEAFAPRKAAATQSVLERYGLNYNSYVLAVGTLEPRKNIRRLCRAYRALPQALRRRYPLVLAGGRGWRQGEFSTELTALQREGHLIATGYLGAHDLSRLYAGAALCVYPSLYEGFGLPVVEAMASGTAVMTSACSSLPEVAGDAAWLVDPHDEAAIRKALRALLEDEARRAELGRRGIERAKLFRWEETARQTLNVYRHVLEND
jgi:alpha-1,3-rhamnosyl/mannosyltransferase